MTASRRQTALLLLAILGVGIASYLVYVHYAHIEPICTTGGCETVQSSRYATVAGIPIASFGLMMYLAILACLIARHVAGLEALKVLPLWIFLLALGGTVYSAYLTYLELWVIHAICQWCVGSALTVTAISVLSVPDLRAIRRGV